MRTRTDAELVVAALGGRRQAFGVLIDRHRPRAVALARRVLGDPREAEDVVQEALIQAFLRLEELRDPERFGAWLCGIAANLAKMRLRASARAPGTVAALDGGRRVPPGALASPDPGPEQVAEARELLTRVRAAVDALPDGMREAVLLHYIEGLSCEEVAALLGRSTGAVRVRLHRARRELRETLGVAEPAAHERLAVGRPRREPVMVEVTLDDVVVRVEEVADAAQPRIVGPMRIVLLRERGGERVVPIWVGAPEGDALALHRGGAATPRPMSADLTLRLLEAAGGHVERVVISSLRETVFYAVVTIATPAGERELDARPSDALNLAVRAGAPILVADDVLAEAGVASTDASAVLDAELASTLAEKGPGEWRSLSAELVLAVSPPRAK